MASLTAVYVIGGSVRGTSGNNAGGLVGQNSGGTITACYATSDVLARYAIGGLVGQNSGGTITACYATGSVSNIATLNNQIGGLVGQNSGGTITACYATGSVSGNMSIGGLVGQDSGGTITACYATGSVSGNMSVGSFVGDIEATISNTIITASYATGLVTGTTNVGGFFGGSSHSNLSVIDSYYDTDTTGRTSSAAGSGRHTSQLQISTNYMGIYANWNIDVDSGFLRGVDNGAQAGDTSMDDPWDFGTSNTYPKLKVDFDGNGTATSAEFGSQ